MKRYLFPVFLLSGMVSSYAMDDATCKIDKVRQGVQQLTGFLNEVDAAISHARTEYSESLASYARRCEQLEREASSSRSVSVDSNPSFDGRQIKEFHHRGMYGSMRTIHLFLERQLYSQSLQLDDVIESNENYFQRFNGLNQENERLKQELQAQVGTRPIQVSQGAFSQPFLHSGQDQIKEARYKKGTFSSSVTVHLCTERQIYGRDPQIDDFVESNENFFRKFSNIRQENERLLHEMSSLMEDKRRSGFLDQENKRLNQTISTLTEDVSRLQRNISDSNVRIEQLSLSVNQKEEYSNSLNIRIKGLESRLLASSEEIEKTKKENLGFSTSIRRLEEEKKSIVSERDQVKSENSSLQLLLKSQQRTVDDLQSKIASGLLYVEDLKEKLDKQARDSRLEIDQLTRGYEEKIRREQAESFSRFQPFMDQGKEKLRLVESERAAAVEKLEKYKRIVRTVLIAPGVPDGLLNQIDSSAK